MFTKLYKIKGTNKYCGPSAMSAAFGIKTQTASKIIRSSNPHIKRVSGLWESDLQKTFSDNNINSSFIKLKNSMSGLRNCPTFNNFVGSCYDDTIYILCIKHHYITLLNGKWIDRVWSKNKPLSVNEFPYKKAKISSYIMVRSGDIKDEVIETKSKLKDITNINKLVEVYGSEEFKEEYNYFMSVFIECRNEYPVYNDLSGDEILVSPYAQRDAYERATGVCGFSHWRTCNLIGNRLGLL